MGRVTLGYLDLGLVHPDVACSVAPLLRLEEMVRAAEDEGFERYWLAEHYATQAAWACPSVLLGALLRRTCSIRIGAGGLLLSVHNAVQVACDYSALATLFPGRVELGLGRGMPEAPWDVSVPCVAEYSEALGVLTAAFHHAPPPYRRIPLAEETPHLWVLGSKTISARLASDHHLPLALSLFHSPTSEPLTRGPRPQLVAVAGVVGTTVNEARKIVESTPSPFYPRACGDAEQVVTVLSALADQHGATNVIFVDLSLDSADRLRTLRLLGSAWRRSE